MPFTYDQLMLTPIAYESSETVKTGSWRTFRPILDRDKCIRCYICWKYCPDVAIDIPEDDAYPKINYDFCKGCGICANECPVKAIQMVKEE